MDNLARARHASVQVAKVQRRIWLLQTILWPAVVIGGIVTTVAIGGWLWRRRTATPATNEVVLATDAPAGPPNPPSHD
jgi:hypothetical protein